MRSVEKVEVRELTAAEIKQVGGGTVTVFKPPFWPIYTPPKHPKPLQA